MRGSVSAACMLLDRTGKHGYANVATRLLILRKDPLSYAVRERRLRTNNGVPLSF